MDPIQPGDLPAILSNPAQRALSAAGITRLEQLTRLSETEVRHWHGIGPNALNLLRQTLAANGLSFAEKKTG